MAEHVTAVLCLHASRAVGSPPVLPVGVGACLKLLDLLMMDL